MQVWARDLLATKEKWNRRVGSLYMNLRRLGFGKSTEQIEKNLSLVDSTSFSCSLKVAATAPLDAGTIMTTFRREVA